MSVPEEDTYGFELIRTGIVSYAIVRQGQTIFSVTNVTQAVAEGIFELLLAGYRAGSFEKELEMMQNFAGYTPETTLH